MPNPNLSPEEQDKVKERVEAFLKDYGELVEKHKIDFINYPMWIPKDTTHPSLGAGGWEMIIQTQPVPTDHMPKKSPFVV